LEALLEDNSRLEAELAFAKASAEDYKGKFLSSRENEGLRSLLNGFTSPLASSGFLFPKSMHPISLLEQIKVLTEENERLQTQNAEIKVKLDVAETAKTRFFNENEKLKEQIQRPVADSSNSSLSPNLDIKDAYKEDQKKKGSEAETLNGDDSQTRKQGAQNGHKARFRDPFGKDEADEIIPYSLPDGCCCPGCGSALVRTPDKDKFIDQYVLPTVTPIK
jgi:hypothetical protein